MANKFSVYFIPQYPPGHLISMVELAKRLSQFDSTLGNSFSIHFILMLPHDPTQHSPLSASYLKLLQAQNTTIQFHILPSIEPPTSFDGIVEFECLRMRSYLPHIKDFILASPSPVSALVVDIFSVEVIDVANELNIPSYIYYTSPATSLALWLHLVSQEGENFPEDLSEVDNISIPGFISIPSTSVPDFFSNRKSASYKWIVYHGRRTREAKAIIINSNSYLEKMAVEALTRGTPLGPGKMLPDIYPVGPVISLGEKKSQDHECLKWLDGQPTKSVVFLCFGSLGAFDVSQNREIACALEQSGHHFLWVLRTPSKEFHR